VQVTVDGFLGGRLRLAQPETGYRAGIDPVLLAAACPAQTGQEVLELGCGVGVASLCLGWRVPGLALSGVEIMGDYAQIARENAARNDYRI
jgi:tRNA1(Val) A37 N6-methylase TrmN6